MNTLKKKPVLFFFIALVVLYVIIYIVPKVTGAMVSSYTAEYGELKIEDETTGYLVRNEYVYLATSSGTANRYIDGGTLIRKDTTVMEVTGTEESEAADTYQDVLSRLSGSDHAITGYVSQESGIVSYYADGYEGKLRPDNMEKGTYNFYSKLSQKNVLDLQRDQIGQGEPVFKIVDRTRWYIVCYVDADHKDRYEEGNIVDVAFEDDTIETEVYSIKEEGNRLRVILDTNYYYGNFAQLRTAEVSLITYDQRGLIIENSSLTEKDDVQGVYVKSKTDDYEFVPVKVLASDGKQSLVEDEYFVDDQGESVSTVELYDEILKEPKQSK